MATHDTRYNQVLGAIGTAPTYPLLQPVPADSILHKNIQNFIDLTSPQYPPQPAHGATYIASQPVAHAEDVATVPRSLLQLPAKFMTQVFEDAVGLEGPLQRRALGYSYLVADPPADNFLPTRFRVEDVLNPDSITDYLALSLSCQTLYAEVGKAFWKRKFPAGDWTRVSDTLLPLARSKTDSNFLHLIPAIVITSGSKQNVRESCDIILVMQGLKTLTFAGLGEIDPTVPVPPTFVARNTTYIDQLLCQESMWFWDLLEQKGVKVKFDADYEAAYEKHEAGWRRLHLLGKVHTPCRTATQREADSTSLSQYFDTELVRRRQIFTDVVHRAQAAREASHAQQAQKPQQQRPRRHTT
ncbi:hypothetical protein BU16DRAFT_532457 [Lophium mytilinum]|uniref:Uncharacterized protein n=1 Tax=Lophium mytilinum TaxID=390894 RepID=A0A6A6RC54_9PEZI|nr:hypothetical protein BU16DRAFT_532457 [Lophium mytilinum]